MNNEIKTNERFDKLTNLDISTYYRDIEVWLFPSDILAALAYWITAQNNNDEIIEIKQILESFKKRILPLWDNLKIPEKFTYGSLLDIINEHVFEDIPEILALNEMKPEFIDLGALARNVFFMILREYITQQ